MSTKIPSTGPTGRPSPSALWTNGLDNTRGVVWIICSIPCNRLTFCVDTFPCSSATLKRLPTSTLLHPSRLQSSRSYAIDSSPHLLYCSSDLVSCLANTRLSTYLEFKALEHICIFQRNHANQREITLEKVPSGREDVFTSTLSLREKRQLMKFLTNAVNAESLGSSPTHISGIDVCKNIRRQ